MNMILQAKVNNNTTDNQQPVISFPGMVAKMGIEELAYYLKNNKMSPDHLNYGIDQLVKKLEAKAHINTGAMDMVQETTFEQQPGTDKGDNEIITKTFNYAWANYGKKMDAATGKPVMFEKLFWSAYGLKNRDQNSNKQLLCDGDEQNAKRTKVKKFLQKCSLKHGFGKTLPRFNCLNRSKALDFLQTIGGTEKEEAELKFLLDTRIVGRDACVDEAGEDTGNYLSDTASIDDYAAGEQALELIVGGMEWAMKLAKNDKERQAIRAWVTRHIVNYVRSNNYGVAQDLGKYADYDLATKLAYADDEKVVLMKYLGLDKERTYNSHMLTARRLLAAGYDLACADTAA